MSVARVPDELTTGPFTREMAHAAGITDRMLRGAPWRQVFNGVWVYDELPDTRDLRLQAARLLIPPSGVLCGLTAAWVLGVDVRRLDDLDVHVGFPKGKRIRKRSGIAVCQETLEPSDITLIDGVRITTPLRTVFDCLRWLWRVEGIVVADALTHAGQVSVPEIAAYFANKRRLRNLRVGERLVEFIEPLTESPMETRLRMLLIDAGLSRPKAQHDVRDHVDTFVGRLDLAYPDVRLGLEYDGADHWKQRREDDRRRAAIRACDWEVCVFSADDVFVTPEATVRFVRQLLRTRAA
jgi:very-short-patch-repair endonuclease